MRLLITGLVLVSAAVAVARPDRPTAHLYQRPDGSFRVRFPSEPRTETRRVASPAGILSVMATQAEANRGLVLAVTVVDYPETFDGLSPWAILDGVRKGLTGLDGKVTADSETAIGPAGSPGRAFTVVAGSNGVRCRAALVGRRLYQVTASGRADAVESREAGDFLGSFELAK